jgi:hypothetical protein
LATIALLLSTSARADRWEPYPDGRPGGCFVNANGLRFDCRNRSPFARPPKAGHEQVLVRSGNTLVLREGPKVEYAPGTPANLRSQVVRAEDYQAEQARQRRLQNAPAERERIRAIEQRSEGCAGALAKLGFTVKQGGICRKEDASFVSCPPCPAD